MDTWLPEDTKLENELEDYGIWGQQLPQNFFLSLNASNKTSEKKNRSHSVKQFEMFWVDSLCLLCLVK